MYECSQETILKIEPVVSYHKTTMEIILENLIKSHEEQLNILKAELDKFTGSLTVRLDDKTYTYKTRYAKCYPDSNIQLAICIHNTCRKNLLEILFGNNYDHLETYDYIYGSKKYVARGSYNLLSALGLMYRQCIDATEKNRLKDIYDTIQAKDTSLVDFYHKKNISADSIDAFKTWFDRCDFKDKPKNMSEKLIIMKYLVGASLPYQDVHQEIVELIKLWLSDLTSYMINIEGIL